MHIDLLHESGSLRGKPAPLFQRQPTAAIGARSSISDLVFSMLRRRVMITAWIEGK
jgi:hypothetical protein